MAHGRRRLEWQQTSTILSMLYNVNRDPKKGRAMKPEDFDPTAEGHGTAPLRVKVSMLKGMFSNR